MRLLDYKTKEQLTIAGIETLSKVGLSGLTQGGVARLLLNIYNEIMGTFYETLSINHANAFLSSAKGEFLEAIGFLLNCRKQAGESDDEYKARIMQQPLSLAAANETAIRFAALSVDQVQDVKMKKFTMGTGSFSIFVLTENATAPEEVLQKVEAAVQQTVGFGNQFDVASPKLLEVELEVKLFFVLSAKESSKTAAIVKAKEALKNYINSRGIGEPIIIDEITQRVMEVSEDVLKYTLYAMSIDGKKVNAVDQIPRWNERYIESASKQEAIITS